MNVAETLAWLLSSLLGLEVMTMTRFWSNYKRLRKWQPEVYGLYSDDLHELEAKVQRYRNYSNELFDNVARYRKHYLVACENLNKLDEEYKVKLMELQQQVTNLTEQNYRLSQMLKVEGGDENDLMDKRNN